MDKNHIVLISGNEPILLGPFTISEAEDERLRYALDEDNLGFSVDIIDLTTIKDQEVRNMILAVLLVQSTHTL